LITIKLENGEVIMCEKLLGVAFRGGKVYHVVDGPVDLIDVLYTKNVMERHKTNIVQQELNARARTSGKSIQVAKN